MIFKESGHPIETIPISQDMMNSNISVNNVVIDQNNSMNDFDYNSVDASNFFDVPSVERNRFADTFDESFTYLQGEEIDDNSSDGDYSGEEVYFSGGSQDDTITVDYDRSARSHRCCFVCNK